MKNIAIYICLLLLITSCISKKESEAIKSCFQEYRSGIIVSSGEIVVPLLNQNTKDYYKKILYHIKHSHQPIVYKLNVVDRILVLSTRNKLTREEIKKLDIKSFLTFAIDNKMLVRYDYLFDLEFIEVKDIEKRKAKARIKLNETNKTLIFTFTKEVDKWKINLSPIIKLNYHIMIRKIKESGISEDKYTIERVKEENNGIVKENIWKVPLNSNN